jgi:hypothetical protein
VSRPVSRASRVVVLLLCSVFVYRWTASIERNHDDVMAAGDFDALYYGARCALHQKDPYDAQTILREFELDGRKIPAASPAVEWQRRLVLTVAVYPPTTFLIVTPLAMLRWPMASTVWLALAEGLQALAVLLVWDFAGEGTIVAGCMALFMLFNSVFLLLDANPAAIITALCVISAWCFVKERYTAAGVVLLALSLVVKPHDAGFIWLYFLLAGGTGRKRALQTLAAAAVLGICAAIWIAPSSPHWFQEWSTHEKLVQARGSTQDPGPLGTPNRSLLPVISLQNSLSVIRDDPQFYNPVTYALVGGLILVWGVVVVRRRATPKGALLALATISILTLLLVYHLSYDAKLLLLAIPACAMLWGEKGWRRWIALVLTSAAIFVTSDLPIYFDVTWTRKLDISSSTLSGKLTLLALQPAPLVLLATGIFYLWVYIRYEPRGEGAGETAAAKWLDAALAE